MTERDDAYYDEVRRAVGRGAPTALLGTSTRSLERSLAKLTGVQQGAAASSPRVVHEAHAGPRQAREHRVSLALSSVLGPVVLLFRHVGWLTATATTAATTVGVTAAGLAIDAYANNTRPSAYLVPVIIGSIVVLILALFSGRKVYRSRVDVRGLVVMIRRSGEQRAELRAPSKWSDTFRFTIRDPELKAARLDYPAPGFPVYALRRTGRHEVSLRTPTGELYDIAMGGPGILLPDYGFELTFWDTSRQRERKWPAPTPTGQGGTDGPAVPPKPEPADRPAQQDDLW